MELTPDVYKLMTYWTLSRVKVYKDSLNNSVYTCDAEHWSALTDPVWRIRKVFDDTIITPWAVTIDSTWVTFTTTWTATYRVWVRITVNNNCTLDNVILESTSASKAYLLDSSENILQQVTITWATVPFSYDLVAWSTYIIAIDNWWLNYWFRINPGWPFLRPYNRTNINYISSYTQPYPPAYWEMYSIVSVQTSMKDTATWSMYVEETTNWYHNPATDLSTVQSLIYS